MAHIHALHRKEAAPEKDRSAGFGRTQLFHPWGRESDEGWLRLPPFRVVRCQIESLIAMGFGIGTVTFGIDHIPLHRISIQCEWAEPFGEL